MENVIIVFFKITTKPKRMILCTTSTKVLVLDSGDNGRHSTGPIQSILHTQNYNNWFHHHAQK